MISTNYLCQSYDVFCGTAAQRTSLVFFCLLVLVLYSPANLHAVSLSFIYEPKKKKIHVIYSVCDKTGIGSVVTASHLLLEPRYRRPNDLMLHRQRSTQQYSSTANLSPSLPSSRAVWAWVHHGRVPQEGKSLQGDEQARSTAVAVSNAHRLYRARTRNMQRMVLVHRSRRFVENQHRTAFVAV